MFEAVTSSKLGTCRIFYNPAEEQHQVVISKQGKKGFELCELGSTDLEEIVQFIKDETASTKLAVLASRKYINAVRTSTRALNLEMKGAISLVKTLSQDIKKVGDGKESDEGED